jgi:hypothetical protein
MKKLLLIAVLIFVSLSKADSQTSWEKLFSGISTDVFRCVKEVPSGGFIAAGYTADSTASDTDAYVVRMNINGDTIWTFRYNGPLSKKDLFYKVINTSDGGFTLCGYTNSVTGLSEDAMYLKLNASGQQQWVKFYGGSSGKERAQDIIQLPDNGYAIVGYTTSAPAQYYDAFLIRTNSTGDTLWTRRFGAANYDDANSVRQLTDGGFIMGGQSNNGANGLDQYLVRTDPNGNLIWQKRFGTLQTDNIECLALLPDGFVLAGNTNTAATGDDGYLVKTDTAGNVIWTKSYGGSLPDDFHRVDTTADGGLVASGTTTSTGPLLPNMWLMRTNSTGDSLWSKTYGGDNHDHGYSGQQTSDGGYIIVGHTGSFGFNNEEGYVVKTDLNGNVSNHLTYTAVLALVSPNATTCGSAIMQVKVKLRNFGNEPVANIPVTVQVTGPNSATLNQTFSASSDTVTFTTTINTSTPGSYTFYCYTGNSNDVTPSRNSITKTFTIDVATPSPTPTSNQRCGNGSVQLSASAANTIYWYTAASGGSTIFTGTAYTTPSLSSTTTYYVQTGTTCPSARVPVTATVNPVSADPIVSGDSICGSGTLILSATASDPVSWYAGPSGGSPLFTGANYTTPVLSSSTNYYAQASNGNCPSNRILVHAIVNTVASDPVPTPDSRCGQGTVTLTANSVDQVLWFDASVGGNQVGSGPTFITPSINTTTTYYAQADNGCLSNRVAISATVNSLAPDPSVTPGFSCGPGTVTLGASSTNPMVWYNAPTGGNQVSTGISFTTPMLTTSTTYYVEANDGTCPSNRIAVPANIYSIPTLNLGNDTVAIVGPSYTLDAGAGFSLYTWSNGATGQTINVTTPGSYCVTITDINTCTNSDCIFVDITDGIHEITKTKFSLFPNPSNGRINIDIPMSVSNPIISLLDITGKTIRVINAIPGKSILDFTSLTRGIYIMKVEGNGYSQVQRIVLQ